MLNVGSIWTGNGQILFIHLGLIVSSPLIGVALLVYSSVGLLSGQLNKRRQRPTNVYSC